MDFGSRLGGQGLSAWPISVVGVRVLHTSDWHLGRTLHGIDLHEHQRAFVEHLVEIVRERSVAAVLISGDVYDRAIPSVESVRLLSDALARLGELCTVIVTPGNHDSAVRLGFASAVMQENVRILASVADLDRPVVLSDGTVDVAVYGVPYLDPETARAALAGDEDDLPARSHEGVLAHAMKRVRSDLAERGPVRSIVMAHAFVVGGVPSDSERDLTVGGVESAPSGIFDGVDYVALGHLHGPQQIKVPGSETVLRYSGSPLAYSFSEKHHIKSSALIEFGRQGTPAVELVPSPVPRPLTALRGSLEDIVSDSHAAHRDDWVSISVTDPSYPENMQSRIREVFPHALQILHEPEGNAGTRLAPEVTQSMSVVQVAGEFVEFVTSRELTDSERKVLVAAYDILIAKEHSV